MKQNVFARQISRIGCMAGIVLASASCARGSDDDMSLRIQLKITPTEAVIQQNLRCDYVLENTGSKAVRVLDPGLAKSMPIWRVTSVDTGIERVFQNKLSMFAKEAQTIEIAAGASLDCGANLLDQVTFAKPGTYDVTVEYEWNDGQSSSRSAPVRITITEANIRYLTMIPEAGGRVALQNLLWVNTSPEGGSLMLTKARLGRRPTLDEVFTLETIDPRIKVYGYEAENRRHPSHRWVAWLELGGIQGFCLEDNEKSSLRVQFTKLPDVPTEIVAPLLPFSETDHDQDAVVVLAQTNEAGRANIQMAVIEKSGDVAEGPATQVQGGRVGWAQGLTLTTGDRRVCVVAQTKTDEGPQLTLQEISWPKKSGELEHVGQAKIDGELLGSAIVVDSDDTVRGAVISKLRESSDALAISLLRWSHAADGRFEAEEPIALTIEPGRDVTDARLGIGDDGKVFGILRRDDGLWLHFNSEEPGLKPVVASETNFSGIVEIAMLGTRAPAIIYAFPPYGFAFCNLDGTAMSPGAHP